MIKSLFTAATGMGAMQENINVISNNLANVSTNGFKRSRAEFQDLLYQTLRMPGTETPQGSQIPTGIQIGMGAKLSAVAKNFQQGDFQQTNNELDLAIQGKGFFQILQPDGTTAYSRTGTFKLDNTGQMVTADGEPLEPPVTIPADAISISISNTGAISVMQPGTVTPNVVGQIELANFINPAGLISVGRGLYKESDASGTPAVSNPGTNELGLVQQGSIETSNVNVVEELTNMILAQRAYEMNSKAITTSDEMMQTANNTKR
ncbi:MAG: flagellar basal-body rod protein FlgG [Nitrospinae bacterium]|nr:flagellar basal-body rod protein FlgG [Nitrospinota bacterium]